MKLLNHRNSVVIFLGLLVLGGLFEYVQYIGDNPDRPMTAIQQVPIGANDVNLVPHNPIVIGCDANFTAANGVVGGSGTSSDPFLIEGWEIQDDGSSYYGIDIGNTTKHFIIRKCKIQSENYPKINDAIHIVNASDFVIQNCSIIDHVRSINGILLNSVRDFLIESTECYETDRGIEAWYAENGMIEGSIFLNNRQCLGMYKSKYLVIRGNTGMCPFFDGIMGIYFQDSFNCSIVLNQITGSWKTGIKFSGESNLVDGNNCSEVDTGISSSSTSYSNITNNTISVVYNGIQLQGNSILNNVSNNRISYRKSCILDGGIDTILKNNVCYKNDDDIPGTSLFWIVGMIAVGALLVLVNRYHPFSNSFPNPSNRSD